MKLKKILAAVLATAMVATLVATPATQANAADAKTMYADTATGDGYTVEYINNNGALIANRAYMGGTTASLEAYTAGHKAVGVAGDSKGQSGKAYSQIIFNFNVETAGEYTVKFYYAAQYKSDTQPRSFAYMVNAENNTYAEGVQYKQYELYDSAKKDDADVLAILTELENNGIIGDGGICDKENAEKNGGWFKIVSVEATITLQAGANKIAVCSPADFDDDTIKAVNFYAVEYSAKSTPKPQTGVATMVIPAAIAMVASGAVALKTSKKKED